MSWCGAATRSRDSRPTGRRTARFVGNIVQAMHAYAIGNLGNPEVIALKARRSPDCDRLRPHDGGGGARAPRGAEAIPEAASLRDRLDQFADAVHDEGNLRAVPAAASRSATAARSATCSRASIRTSRSTASTGRRSTSGCGRTPCRKNSLRCGSAIACTRWPRRPNPAPVAQHVGNACRPARRSAGLR